MVCCSLPQPIQSVLNALNLVQFQLIAKHLKKLKTFLGAMALTPTGCKWTCSRWRDLWWAIATGLHIMYSAVSICTKQIGVYLTLPILLGRHLK